MTDTDDLFDRARYWLSQGREEDDTVGGSVTYDLVRDLAAQLAATKELVESRGGQIYLRDQRIAVLEDELAAARTENDKLTARHLQDAAQLDAARILACKAISSTAKNSEVARAMSDLFVLLAAEGVSR